MNIGLNIGHYGTKGAMGFLDEAECAIEIYNKLKPLLEKVGHKVVPCNDKTPKDYVSATKLANKLSLDLLISLHLNSFPKDTAHGTEVLYYKGNKTGEKYAAGLSKAISTALGTYNRGAKPVTDIYIIKNTKATCVLLECLFVSNSNDSKKYDADKIAKAVASYFGYKEKVLTGVSEIVSELSKHIDIGDKQGLIKEINSNPSGRLYWICQKVANKLKG